MTTWDDVRLTCIHGVREGLDSHDCPKCLEIAKKRGDPTDDGQTYIYTDPPDAET